MSDNVSEPLDRARAGRILPEGNVSPYLIVIGGVFRKNSPKVFCVALPVRAASIRSAR